MNKIKYLSAVAGALLIAQPAFAQTPNWPARTVRIIVPYAAGGNTDFTARSMAVKLTEMWGQQIIVDNRPGGATNIGSEIAAKAVPDGYTLFMGGASNAVNMSLFAKPPYDTLRDFAPIVLCVQGANLFAVHPSVPAKNLKELIALAKRQPGKLNFASSGIGSSNQMAGELLKVTAGVNIVHVPYKGNAPAIVDGISGNVEIVISGVPAMRLMSRAPRSGAGAGARRAGRSRRPCRGSAAGSPRCPGTRIGAPRGRVPPRSRRRRRCRARSLPAR